MMRAKIKKMIRPIVPKPWNSPVMEFRYGLWTGVSALFAESGRQLGEANARPFLLNHQVPAETVICNYEGSRFGRAINTSALRIAMKHFDRALPIIGAVRKFHLEKTGQVATDVLPGTWDLYIIARASIGIVAYRNRYCVSVKEDPVLTDTLASLFQFISGVFMICRQMMTTADPVIAENNVISAEALYAYADDNGVFISPNGMACAGGIAKIMEFLEFCCSGRVSGNTTGIDDKDFNLDTIISDPENWYQYALATVELDCFTELENLRLRHGSQQDQSERINAIERVYKAVALYCSSNDAFTTQFSDTTDFKAGVLERQNYILTLLGKPKISTISDKIIAERLSIGA